MEAVILANSEIVESCTSIYIYSKKEQNAILAGRHCNFAVTSDEALIKKMHEVNVFNSTVVSALFKKVYPQFKNLIESRHDFSLTNKRLSVVLKNGEHIIHDLEITEVENGLQINFK